MWDTADAGGEHPDPWAELRARRPSRDGRTADNSSRFMTPDAAERLWVATGAVLASVRQLVVVAEEVVQERIDAYRVAPDSARSAPANDETGGHRFESVDIDDSLEFD